MANSDAERTTAFGFGVCVMVVREEEKIGGESREKKVLLAKSEEGLSSLPGLR